jgi:hypothetical protein
MTKHNILRKEQPISLAPREQVRYPRIEWGSYRQRIPIDDRADRTDEVPLLPSESRGLKSSLRKLGPHRRLKSVRFWPSSEEAVRVADSTSVDTQWPSSRNANGIQRDRTRALQASEEPALESVTSSTSSQTCDITYVPMKPYVSVWSPQAHAGDTPRLSQSTLLSLYEEPALSNSGGGWNHVLPPTEGFDISRTLRFAANDLARTNHTAYPL